VLNLITAKSGNALNEEALEVDRQKILDLLPQQGLQQHRGAVPVSRDEAAGNAVVYFSINEGGKAELSYIVFEATPTSKRRPSRR